MDRIAKSLGLFLVCLMANSVPNFFVYGEPDRPLEPGFMHVETVMARKNVHLGRVDAHSHARMAQITFWTKGHGTYFIEEQRLDFLAPAVSFVPSGVVHGFTVEPSETDAIVVSIADSALAPLDERTILPIDAPVMIADTGDPASWARLSRIMQQMADEYREGRPGMEMVLTALATVAMTEIARFGSGQTGDLRPAQTVLASQFRQLVDRHFRENWPVERYVDELGTTPHLLTKACQSAFGLSVKEFLSERRLLEAKRLLLFTVRPLEDIAYEVGLKDAAYFSRFFKHHTGQPPSVWREQYPRH
ncbi:helix-turn-helix domain-containing protein (plasmid) [Rhizobium grahamii]|uniref:Helix-turn-helix domain-containing protein n=2 Tax=Rhizobium/Agrobacterium group TaxID=227290 RepID=A0A5Q0CFH6_9HYPH|nr:helix-turn-helix domain-containing protein [Rhizobium grahamii]QRM52001.1 helix-turn-helix domain-containing protein [Rhizobium sp. BG6]